MLRTPQRSAAPDLTQENPTTTRRRRGLGPFTGGQLTAIIIAVVVVAGFPFAAFAVTGNNVFVTDATSGTRAKVTSAGQLQTNDSHLKDDVFGNLKVATQGGVRRPIAVGAATDSISGPFTQKGYDLNGVVWVHVRESSTCADIRGEVAVFGDTPRQPVAFGWTLQHDEEVDVALPAAVHVTSVNFAKLSGSCSGTVEVTLLTQ